MSEVDILGRVSEIRREENMARSLTKKANGMLETLRKDIMMGKVEGPIFDKFMVNFYRANEKAWEVYGNLQNKLMNAKGEDVIIVNEKKKPYSLIRRSSGCVPSPVIYETDINLSIGRLSGERIDFDLSTNEVIFPTDRQYVNMHGTYTDYSKAYLNDFHIEKKVGRIRKNVEELFHLNKLICPDIFLSNMFYENINFSDILVGGEVKKYFKEAIGGKGFMKKLVNY